MIDMTTVIATALSDDTDIANTGVPGFADIVPEGQAAPYYLVRTMSVAQAVPPVDLWDRYDVQIDVVCDSDGAGVDLVSLIRSRTLALSGVHGVAGIAGAIPVSTVRTVDDSVSPARPRWVLTVEVTARHI